MTTLHTYNEILSIKNYLLIIEYKHYVSRNFKGHKFMCGPQDPKIFGLGP
jgi:hypothetical protein